MYCTVQYSLAQCSQLMQVTSAVHCRRVVQCSAVQPAERTIWCSVVQPILVQCSTAGWCSAMQVWCTAGVVQYSTGGAGVRRKLFTVAGLIVCPLLPPKVQSKVNIMMMMIWPVMMKIQEHSLNFNFNDRIWRGVE